MKKFFIALAVISVLASAVSCEYDAPNINFTTTVTNDYSEVVQAIEDQTLTLAEKLKIINDALDSQTLTITQQADILKKAYENGVIKYEELFEKLLDRLGKIKESTEEKLDAIKGALETGNDTMKTKLDAINKAINKGVVDINAKQDLILTALNSMSSYKFTKDELLEVGDDYLLVHSLFWNKNFENYEVVRALMDLIPISLPARYKFWYHQASGKYPFNGSEPTSFYGPAITDGGIFNCVRGASDLFLAIDLEWNSGAPRYRSVGEYNCYLIKKVYKSGYAYFIVDKGDKTAGIKVKPESMPNKDLFNDYSNVITYEHYFEAEKGRTGVWGYRGLANGQLPGDKVKSVDFIFVKDE